MCKAVTIKLPIAVGRYCVDSVPVPQLLQRFDFSWHPTRRLIQESVKGNARGLPDRLDPAYAARLSGWKAKTRLVVFVTSYGLKTGSRQTSIAFGKWQTVAKFVRFLSAPWLTASISLVGFVPLQEGKPHGRLPKSFNSPINGVADSGRFENGCTTVAQFCRQKNWPRSLRLHNATQARNEIAEDRRCILSLSKTGTTLTASRHTRLIQIECCPAERSIRLDTDFPTAPGCKKLDSRNRPATTVGRAS